jgi:hypothetical protein
VTPRHDFIDFLLKEHLLSFFLLAEKIIDSKKVWFKYTPKIHTKNGWLKWLSHQNWLFHQKNFHLGCQYQTSLNFNKINFVISDDTEPSRFHTGEEGSKTANQTQG